MSGKKSLPVKEDAPKELNVILLGRCLSGKSMLVLRFVEDVFFFEPADPIDDEYKKQITVDGNTFMLHIDDMTAFFQEEEWAINILERNCKKADIVLLVYDITNRDSFESMDEYRATALRYCEKSPAFFAVGTKMDEEGSRAVSKEEASEYFRNLQPPVHCLEVSSRTGENVHEVFENAVRLWMLGPDKRKANLNDNIDEDEPEKCIIN